MLIEPLSTIIAWVLGICAIIFIPLGFIFATIFLIKVLKEL